MVPSAMRGFFCAVTLTSTMGLYARWMDRWERKLASHDTNRVVRRFEWGTDWLHTIPFPQLPGNGTSNGHTGSAVARFIRQALENSDLFYSYERVTDYSLKNGQLTFTSP